MACGGGVGALRRVAAHLCSVFSWLHPLRSGGRRGFKTREYGGRAWVSHHISRRSPHPFLNNNPEGSSTETKSI